MPRPTTLLTTLALAGALGATALAQTPATVRLRGTIGSLAGNTLTVQGAATTYSVTLPDQPRVTFVVKSDISKIGPNTYIGTIAVPQPDGTLKAVEVQIFPEAQRGVGEGSHPWDSVANGTMTNATVATIAPERIDKIDGQTMTVKYKDSTAKVFIPAGAPIVTYAPADKSALVPGAHVIVTATKGADGGYTSTNVQVGKDGLVPPM